MSCSRAVILLACWLSASTSGCTLPFLQTSALLATAAGWQHGGETRAIEQFVTGLQEEDIDRLRRSVTPRFAQAALAHEGAIDDLKLLNLPKGEVTVLEVLPTADDEFEVKAQVGDAGREYTYLLAIDRRTHGMQIDDVFVTQQVGGGRGEVTQSVTAQLELLQAGRRFLTAWHEGSREQVMTSTTELFRTELEALPPSFLVKMTQQVAGDRRLLTSFRPESRIDDEHAALIFHRSSGELVLEMRRVEGTWLVNDAAIVSDRDNEAIPSARRLARTLRTAAEFLNAYDQNDKEALARTAHTGFYDACLNAANPDAVPLPVNELLSGSYELRTHGEAVDVVLSHQPARQTYLVTLEPTPVLSLEDDSDRRNLPKLVREVSIYEADGAQVKTLTSIYTSRVIVQLFAQALTERDSRNLEFLSTPEFNSQVWQQCDDDVLRALPFDGIDTVVPEVNSTVFHGPVTEVTVTQGRSALTYVLKQVNDRLQVDDVLVPSPQQNRPTSLKTNLRLLTPVYRLAYAIHRNDREVMGSVCGHTLQRTCSQLDGIPDIGCRMVDHLLMPVASIHPSADRTVVKLGDGGFGADVTLRSESNRWVIEDISFVTGPAPEQRIELLAALRRHNTLQMSSPEVTAETQTAQGPATEVLGDQSDQPSPGAEAEVVPASATLAN
jgi:hypothetical protein